MGWVTLARLKDGGARAQSVITAERTCPAARMSGLRVSGSGREACCEARGLRGSPRRIGELGPGLWGLHPPRRTPPRFSYFTKSSGRHERQ
ncbi:hypothetical protein chiPu_0032253 [Chiloscyllium punctatum]|uniref:Uncharacterized protein n=1 Tax=Chiloscyllium punctatum TaxID=137246 RepID=A0A401TZV3_CHIPU|nr:hypothetical protein [Chiloscyllium punctatum]